MYRWIKTFIDFVIAFFSIIILSPIFFIVIIGIELSDPGPVFFKAKRIGFKGKEFTMLKFRSMRIPKSEEEKSEISFKADTNRIFPFGAFIRRLKIDELAQLFNLLNGTMAIVGPRPASIDQVSIMREGKYSIANTVKPGLTGPAALYDYIYGDSIEDLEDYKRLVLPNRKELEAFYPKHIGFFFDVRIIIWTGICIIFALFKKKPKRIFNKLNNFAEQEKVLG